MPLIPNSELPAQLRGSQPDRLVPSGSGCATVATRTLHLPRPFRSGGVSRKLCKPVDRLVVRDLTSRHVLQFLTHISRRIAGALPGPATRGLPPYGHLPASSAAGIRSMSNGVAISGPSHRRNHVATGRMADQGGNGGHARRARPQSQAGPQRIRASALSLQHRGACLRGHATEGARSADRAREWRSRSCHPAREGRQDAPVPTVAGNRTSSGRRDPRALPR
jgi:hypothetical protein